MMVIDLLSSMEDPRSILAVLNYTRIYKRQFIIKKASPIWFFCELRNEIMKGYQIIEIFVTRTKKISNVFEIML